MAEKKEETKKVEPAKKAEEKKVEAPKISSIEAIKDFFDEIPSKEPIVVSIAGFGGMGKTHFSNTFPNPVIADTEGRAQAVMKKFGHKFRKNCKDLDTIRNTITMMAQHLCPDESKRHEWTFVLDSASDVQQMAESEWLKEAKKDKVFPLVLWAKVYDKIDQIFDALRKLGFNAVLTQQLREIYRNEKATGEFEPAGYKKIPYRVDISLLLRKGVEFDGELYYPEVIVAEVLKDWWNPPTKKKPYLIDVSYDGIFNELKNYKHPGTHEEAVKQILKELEKKTGIPIAEAKVKL